MSNFDTELVAAKEAVVAAGKAAMQFYDIDHNVNMKEGGSPVTDADLASEKVLMEHLTGFGYSILSEETEDDLSRLSEDLLWIMDPLDGTKDFIQRTGEFSIMVGLVKNGVPVVAVVYEPVNDRLFYASKDGGAFVDIQGETHELRVSDFTDFSDFRMFVSRNHLLDLEVNLAKELGITTQIPCGSAGLKSSLVALNKGDIYLNTSTHTFEWDICAADLIVTEAGGTVTTLDGDTITYNKEDTRNHRGFVVSNGKRHSEIIGGISTLL